MNREPQQHETPVTGDATNANTSSLRDLCPSLANKTYFNQRSRIHR